MDETRRIQQHLNDLDLDQDVHSFTSTNIIERSRKRKRTEEDDEDDDEEVIKESIYKKTDENEFDEFGEFDSSSSSSSDENDSGNESDKVVITVKGKNKTKKTKENQTTNKDPTPSHSNFEITKSVYENEEENNKKFEEFNQNRTLQLIQLTKQKQTTRFNNYDDDSDSCDEDEKIPLEHKNKDDNECFLCFFTNKKHDKVYAPAIFELVDVMEKLYTNQRNKELARTAHLIFKNKIYLKTRIDERTKMLRTKSILNHLRGLHIPDPRFFIGENVINNNERIANNYQQLSSLHDIIILFQQKIFNYVLNNMNRSSFGDDDEEEYYHNLKREYNFYNSLYNRNKKTTNEDIKLNLLLYKSKVKDMNFHDANREMRLSSGIINYYPNISTKQTKQIQQIEQE